MKTIGFISGVTIAVVMFSSPAIVHAQGGEPGSGPNPFTDCGIGAALFPDTHWAAVTSNIIWDVGTTAVTSATSSPETCQGQKAKVSRFIHETYDKVVEDTARGNGEYLVTLLDMYGCESSARTGIVADIRAGVGQSVAAPVYASLDSVSKSAQLYEVVDTTISSKYSANCTI